MPRICERCHDPLPADAPPEVRTCKEWADHIARTEGDMLSQERAEAMVLFCGLCGLSEAMRQGWEEMRADV